MCKDTYPGTDPWGGWQAMYILSFLCVISYKPEFGKAWTCSVVIKASGVVLGNVCFANTNLKISGWNKLVSHSLAQLASKSHQSRPRLSHAQFVIWHAESGTARSVPDPSSSRGDWGLGTRLIPYLHTWLIILLCSRMCKVALLVMNTINVRCTYMYLYHGCNILINQTAPLGKFNYNWLFH